ncbi:MAG: serine/threonine protein kinase [Actinomycetota bacterium]|nr:serine/threonine protein kinase [Actinomycetota bacterium]
MVGERIAGRYDLEEVVGTGGMSSVYRAYDSVLDRHVALKILHEHYSSDEGSLERFRREARAAAQLSHPNIVTVIDRGEEGGRPFIVFEYVDGETLKRVVEERGPLPVQDALVIALDVARALAFAHVRGVVHRDVKPQNVLLDGEGRARVTDFGIARSLNLDVGVTQTGTVLGTSEYMAPEQAKGERASARSDVYSLGAVLYELLAGDVVFPGESFMAVALRHIGEPPRSILERRPDVPLRLATALDRCLAKDPRERFRSMDELVDELEACLAELDARVDEQPTLIVPGARLRRLERREPTQRRRRMTLAVFALALLALAVLVAVAVLERDSVRDVLPLADVSTPVALAGVTAYDPEGDDNGWEHDEEAPSASDGSVATYWPTETYNSWYKSGVGLVLAAERPVALSELTVRTDTPDFRARIRAGRSEQGPFVDVSEVRRMSRSTTFDVDTRGKRYRYYLIWMQLPNAGVAHVNEVTGKA